MNESANGKGGRTAYFTRRALRENLLHMLRTTPIDKITVTELCTRSGVNRSTFYLHYRDVFDLLETIENDFYNELEGVLSKTSRYLPSVELLTNIYEIVLQNRDLCETFLSDDGNRAFLARLVQIQHGPVMYDWSDTFPHLHKSTLEHMHAFVTGTNINIILNWVRGGYRESPRDLAKIANQLMMKGISSFVSEKTVLSPKFST